MKRELTGRHVLGIAILAFGTIIGVNLVLAYNAVRTFPGLETASSYIASQHFDRQRAAQQSLGWQASLEIEGGRAVLRILDRQGAGVFPETLTLQLRRPTHQRDDIRPALTPEAPGRWSAHADLAPGNWNADIEATDRDGTLFRQRLYLAVGQGD
ncbi:FixH family protein [Paracoccus bogoriensis]|uniref:FixH family protein n=1 Tax=Paracoccus bogoriensis TaxID=242065 RepID=UPI001C67B8DE|nr:FixH family protein [Paracoccus bogoriensis]MBW7055892.1 FixH family protein [Paracoccus bogoriensis]